MRKMNPAKVYKVVEEIGSGAVGKVFRVERLEDKKNFAVKVVEKPASSEK